MLKTSREWAEVYNLTGLGNEIDSTQPYGMILDPDGWDRKNFDDSVNEIISQEEFFDRCSKSTCSLRTAPFAKF